MGKGANTGGYDRALLGRGSRGRSRRGGCYGYLLGSASGCCATLESVNRSHMRIEVYQLDLYVSSEHGHRGRGLVGQPRWLQRCLFLIRSPP